MPQFTLREQQTARGRVRIQGRNGNLLRSLQNNRRRHRRLNGVRRSVCHLDAFKVVR